MNFDQPITRRESVKKLLQLSGGLALASSAPWPFQSPFSAWAASNKRKFIIEGIGQSEDYTIKDLTRKVFDAAGGISQLVSKGDVVVIKPNISWARRPELAATTHPEVLEAVIELCQEAGAKRVRIADNTIFNAGRCFAITGAGMVSEKTGAELIYPRSSLMRKMNLRGDRLDVWPVFIPLVEADKIINLPVAKHHSLSSLSLGMKSWIMTRNGPTGGSTADVEVKNTLILSNDPVAADAKAALLLNHKPQEIGFIRLGQKWGLGTYDFQKLDRKKVVL